MCKYGEAYVNYSKALIQKSHLIPRTVTLVALLVIQK